MKVTNRLQDLINTSQGEYNKSVLKLLFNTISGLKSVNLQVSKEAIKDSNCYKFCTTLVGAAYIDKVLEHIFSQ